MVIKLQIPYPEPRSRRCPPLGFRQGKKDFLYNKFKIKNLFKYNQNKFSFTVSLTDFKNENINKFRYRLDGFENKYSKF